MLSLPPEIIESVYHHVNTIDDVHSLGRTHRKTLRVIQRQTVYTEIMRSIIGRSWIRRYHVQLCNVLALHKEIVSHFKHNGNPFPMSSTYDVYNEWEIKLASETNIPGCASGPCAACVPDSIVTDNLAQYQAMRVLEDMWLERQLEDQDFLSTDMSEDEKGFIRHYASLFDRAQDFEQGGLPKRSTQNPAPRSYVKLNPD